MKKVFYKYYSALFLAALISGFCVASENNVIWKGSDKVPYVALTFDDGPKPEFSETILDILSKEGIKASFFVVGKEAKEHPDIILRMSHEGHEINNHTYSHLRVSGLSKSKVAEELRLANQVVYDITGSFPKFFRPPGGSNGPHVSVEVAKKNMRIANWSVNAGDYVEDSEVFELDEDFDESAKKLEEKILAEAHNGAIILFHNGSPQTIRSLPRIISGLRARGLGFTTVSGLLAMEK